MDYKSRELPKDETISIGNEFFELMNARRSVRAFSDKPVPQEVIELAVKVANTAPSGANQQPWIFCATNNPEIKKRIRIAAEIEEHENYEGGRMPPAWRKALSHIGTNSDKGYLEVVPWIVVAFAQKSLVGEDGESVKTYYVKRYEGKLCLVS